MLQKTIESGVPADLLTAPWRAGGLADLWRAGWVTASGVKTAAIVVEMRKLRSASMAMKRELRSASVAMTRELPHPPLFETSSSFFFWDQRGTRTKESVGFWAELWDCSRLQAGAGSGAHSWAAG